MASARSEGFHAPRIARWTWIKGGGSRCAASRDHSSIVKSELHARSGRRTPSVGFHGRHRPRAILRQAWHGHRSGAAGHRRRSGHVEGRRQRGGRGGGGRLRARRHPSVCRQHRRRRLHADPHGRRPLHVHRLSRSRARQGLAQHVSGRARQSHQGRPRRLARLGRSRHRARLRVGGEEVRRQEVGRPGGPGAELAARGFTVSYALSRSLESANKLLGQFPESKRIFLKGGVYYEPATRFASRNSPAP